LPIFLPRRMPSLVEFPLLLFGRVPPRAKQSITFPLLTSISLFFSLWRLLHSHGLPPPPSWTVHDPGLQRPLMAGFHLGWCPFFRSLKIFCFRIRKTSLLLIPLGNPVAPNQDFFRWQNRPLPYIFCPPVAQGVFFRVLFLFSAALTLRQGLLVVPVHQSAIVFSVVLWAAVYFN